MRDAAPLALPALVVLYWAFRTGLHWHEPDKLAAFWGLHGAALVVAVSSWALWKGLGALYGRLVLGFEKGKVWERAYVVAYLKHHATRCDSRTQSALDVMADDLQQRLHHPRGDRP